MPRRVVEFKIQLAVKLASLSLRVEPGIPSLLNVIGSTNPMVQTICHDTCDIDLYSIFTENILDRRVAGQCGARGLGLALQTRSHTGGPSRPAGRRGTVTVGVTSQWSLEAAAAGAGVWGAAGPQPPQPARCSYQNSLEILLYFEDPPQNYNRMILKI